MHEAGAAGLDGKRIATRLYDYLAADRDMHQAIAELQCWAFNVEIELKTGAMWTIECLGNEAYHFYPAHIRPDGAVVWLNVWVTDDLKLDEMIARVRNAVFG